MRLLPRSLQGRLLALSLLATLAALAVAGIAIGGVLERFVTSTIDARLSDRLVALGAAVRTDGTIDAALARRVAAQIAPDEPWRIDAPRGTLASAPPLPRDAAAGPDGPHPPRPPPPAIDAPQPPRPGPEPASDTRPFEAGENHRRVHGLTYTIDTAAGAAEITAAVPRRLIERPIRAALVPLALSLVALGAALALAAVVQLRVGLRPLRRLGEAVASVRSGMRQEVPTDAPDELRPLAAELNALVADNRAALATARGSAANLAHALKTPLATLSLAVREPGRDPDGDLRAQVERLDATVRHHLARARAEVAETRVATALAPALRDLADTVSRIHAERGVAINVDTPDDLFVALAPADLDELAGNLLDNAVRHARTTVRVAASRRARAVTLLVEDDGPGIAAADIARATAPGMRLDERGDGHGFGLAIARDLAALYGGSLELGSGALGGLAASVTLPVAPTPHS